SRSLVPARLPAAPEAGMTRLALIGMLLCALACGVCHGSDKLTDSSQQLPTPSPTPSGDWNAQTRTEQTGSMQTGAGQSENNDLDRIPPSSPEPATPKSKTPAASGANQRIYVENAFTVSSHRGGLIVPAAQEAAQTPWQERLFLDIRKEWKVDNRLNLILSDRLNLRYANDLALPNHENVINDFREGFISWEPRERVYLDIGRINLRSGAALGFNPTDFFKTRAVVEPLTSDPSVLREDRLGTLMLETQYIGQGRALTVALAPALLSSTPVYSNANLPSFNPSIDRTNDHFRLLVKGSFNIGSDFSPELLFYHEGNQIKFGANLTRSFGQRIIAYGEWAGGERTNLIDEALRYGRQTGTLPAAAPSAVPDDPRTRFENDLSLGASYTSSKKITLNLEYHLHQSGFTMKDWSNWFG